MIKSTSLWMCLMALFAGVYSQCVMDYECGNLPYSICKGGVNDCSMTVPGLGVDAESNLVYFAQICRTDNPRVPNVTFKSVEAAGGVPKVVQTRNQINAAANPGFVFDVADMNLYYSIQSRSPGQLLTALNLPTKVESDTIDTNSFFQNIIEFDQTNRKTYVCNINFGTNGSYAYDLRAFDAVLAPGVSVNNYTLETIEIPSICVAIRAFGSDLYFAVATPDANYTTYNSSIYKRSASSDSDAVLQFTVDGRIQDFDVSDSRIYYGTTTGVYSSTLSGGDVKRISWSSGSTGVRILGDRVYWNSGVAILSDSLAGGNVQQVNQFEGSCGCRSGFSGSSCTTCSGQVQWFEGTPSCIFFADNGSPLTCNYDYECGNAPYSYCAGSCRCRPGLGGSGCRNCQNTTQSLTWVNGLPTCQ